MGTNYFIARNEKQAQACIADLKGMGYHRISNCYWFEEWRKEEEIFTIERDFRG